MVDFNKEYWINYLKRRNDWEGENQNLWEKAFEESGNLQEGNSFNWDCPNESLKYGNPKITTLTYDGE